MSEYSEYYMFMGRYWVHFPKGYNSEKRECPLCKKRIAGRDDGMTSHLKLKHGISNSEERIRISSSIPYMEKTA